MTTSVSKCIRPTHIILHRQLRSQKSWEPWLIRVQLIRSVSIGHGPSAGKGQLDMGGNYMATIQETPEQVAVLIKGEEAEALES